MAWEGVRSEITMQKGLFVNKIGLLECWQRGLRRDKDNQYTGKQEMKGFVPYMKLLVEGSEKTKGPLF